MHSVDLTRDRIGYAYDPAVPPALIIDPGATIVVETHDARTGTLDHHAPGDPFELSRPPAHGNPLTGPIAVRGARPGDALAVTIEAIDVAPIGWAGAHAHFGPLAAGAVPRPLARRVAIEDGRVRFGDGIDLPLRPMIGCLGTAPRLAPGETPPRSVQMGRFGGNMDQPIVTTGATVLLPVAVPDALVYVGDVHACQGDGELSGVALEIAATVRLHVALLPGRAPAWPWATWGDRVAVLTADEDFTVARREACAAMVAALQRAFPLETAEAMAVLSIAGDVRMGQTSGGGPMTLRLELPAFPGLIPG